MAQIRLDELMFLGPLFLAFCILLLVFKTVPQFEARFEHWRRHTWHGRTIWFVVAGGLLLYVWIANFRIQPRRR